MVRLLGAGLLLLLVPVVAQAEEPLRSAPSATAGVEKACGAGTEADEREFAAALDAFAQRRAFTQKLMAAREAEAFEQAIAHQARADKLKRELAERERVAAERELDEAVALYVKKRELTRRLAAAHQSKPAQGEPVPSTPASK